MLHFLMASMASKKRKKPLRDPFLPQRKVKLRVSTTRWLLSDRGTIKLIDLATYENCLDDEPRRKDYR